MKKLQTLFILVISILSIESCISDDALNIQSVQINETFEMKFHQEVALELEPLQMKIIDIIEDSRCPINDNSNCFWSGQVRVEVELKIEEQVVNRELMFRFDKDTPLIYGKYGIQIERVTPENQIDELIELEGYQFEIKINKQSVIDKA